MSKELKAGDELDLLIHEKVMGNDITKCLRYNELFKIGIRRIRESSELLAMFDGSAFFSEPELYREYLYLKDSVDTRVPGYSQNIKFALEVIEKFRDQGKTWQIQSQITAGQAWRIQNHDDEALMLDGWSYGDEYIYEERDSLPLAICLAALKVFE